jgi:hypothetical protein
MMVQIQCIGFGSRGEAIGDKALLKDKRRQRTSCIGFGSRGGEAIGDKALLKDKRRQRTRIRSMRRKCDMTQRRGDVDRRRWSTGEGKGRRRCQLG